MRALRERKPVTYNEDVLQWEQEASHGAALAGNQKGILKFVQPGVKPVFSKPERAQNKKQSREESGKRAIRSRNKKGDSDGEQDQSESSADEDFHHGNAKSVSVIPDSESGSDQSDEELADSEEANSSGSDEDTAPKRKSTRSRLAGKKRQQLPGPSRVQPRRVAAAAVCLKELSDSESLSAGSEDDDLPSTSSTPHSEKENQAPGQAPLEDSLDSDEEQKVELARRNSKRKGLKRAIQEAGARAGNEKRPRKAAKPAGRKRRAVSSDEEEEGDSGQGSSESEEEEKQEEAGAPAKEEEQVLKRLRHEVERVLAMRCGTGGQDEFFVKFKGMCHRRAAWVASAPLQRHKPQLLRNFIARRSEEEADPSAAELRNGVHPDWLRVERIIAKRKEVRGTSYLVKWCGLQYGEGTWEPEDALANDQEAIDKFEEREKVPQKQKHVPVTLTEPPTFDSGRTLRDYQVDSLKWMLNNYNKRRNCILGDEMGLGKTAQSISVLECQRRLGGARGPFLVIAPLTTLGHWQREIETWTPMNVVLYAGNAADREIIRKHEFPYTKSSSGQYKFEVLLCSYEMVLKDAKVFLDIPWQTVVIDEAHRMKSTRSATRGVIAGMRIGWLLLLTGTPVQNNMRELYGLLNLLDPERYGDEADFLERFTGDGENVTAEQLPALQDELRPLLIRRMKEDVEQLPTKEEVIVWVQLTPQQNAYYAALYKKEIGTLLSGATNKNVPNMRNLCMELRKLCCHPFLCNGLADDFALRRGVAAGSPEEAGLVVAASGKMVLLDKLLPRLRADGHKVLIFSQFKGVLDILEDYLRLNKHPVERIDGDVKQRDRQQAIDRFSKGEEDSFVFLLSTKAGGQGITLTAADTVIIYDSDWNPQNDLQAMARCHRIGQVKEVTIYRLVSKGTYEEAVFATSSRRYGLDAAILDNLNTEAPGLDSKQIANLLKFGAHALNPEAKDEEGDAFAGEDIDQILEGRTEKRQIGGRAGNTFSVVNITMDAPPMPAPGGEGDKPEQFWGAVLGADALEEHRRAEEARKRPVELGRRQRRAVNYNEAKLGIEAAAVADNDDFQPDAEGSGSDSEIELEEEGTRERGRRKRGGGCGQEKAREWKLVELRAVLEKLVAFGPGRTADIKAQAGLSWPVEDVEIVEKLLIDLIRRAAKIAEAKDAAEMDAKLAELRSLRPEAEQDEAAKPPYSARCGVKPSDPVIAPDADLPENVAKALRSPEISRRMLTAARRWLAVIEERAALTDLMTRLESETDRIAASVTLFNICDQVYEKGAPRLPRWWDRAADRALLEGSHRLGGCPWGKSGMTSETRRTVEAILVLRDLPFCQMVKKAGAEEAASAGEVLGSPVRAPQLTPSKRTAEPGLCGTPGPASKPLTPMLRRSPRVLGAASTPDRAAAAAAAPAPGPQLLEPPAWTALVEAVARRLRALLQAVMNPPSSPRPRPAKRHPHRPKGRPPTQPVLQRPPADSAGEPSSAASDPIESDASQQVQQPAAAQPNLARVTGSHPQSAELGEEAGARPDSRDSGAKPLATAEDSALREAQAVGQSAGKCEPKAAAGPVLAEVRPKAQAAPGAKLPAPAGACKAAFKPPRPAGAAGDGAGGTQAARIKLSKAGGSSSKKLKQATLSFVKFPKKPKRDENAEAGSKEKVLDLTDSADMEA